ncbi:putative toxin-antitoxin system toxin component, PIN family [Spirosoma knui]
MKIVVDTNVLLNAILPTSGNFWLFEGIISGTFTLCVSNEILTEYSEVFSRFYDSTVAESFLTALTYSPFVEKTDTYFHWIAIEADPDDNKFVDCAVAANAQCIITNDRHFDVLQKLEFPKVSVLSPYAFRQIAGA